jgi:glycosyltransferase involved in cell wall biosynthesis
MQIQHVITTLDVGGAEVHLLSQVRGQAARGHQVSVAYLKGQGSLTQEFLDAGAKTVERVSPIQLMQRLGRADLIHSHLLKADMLTALLCLITFNGSKLVSSKHNDERALLHPVFSRIHGVLGRVPKRTIILSKHVVEFFATHGRLPRKPLRQIYYGLNPAPFEAAARFSATERATRRAELGLGPDDTVLICVARFAPQKRHDLLLEAFSKARSLVGGQGQGELRMLLVGGDPFGDGQAQAETVAARLQLGDSVSFLGIRRDVPDLYGLSDVFVMFSEWEGLGLVFLEAMAANLPVVATGVSAVPEVVVDGTTGTLVPFGDTDAMAAAFAELKRQPEKARAMGQAGHARVLEAFNLDRMVEETLAVYAEVTRAQT